LQIFNVSELCGDNSNLIFSYGLILRQILTLAVYSCFSVFRQFFVITHSRFGGGYFKAAALPISSSWVVSDKGHLGKETTF